MTTPTAAVDAFSAGGCAAAAGGGSPTAPASDNFKLVITVPAGWSLISHPPDGTTLFMLQAPPAYRYQPTSIRIQSLIGYFRGQAAVKVIEQQLPAPATAPASACSVLGDSAASVPFAQGTRAGYFVLWLHFGYGYGLTLEGEGGVDSRAIRDAKAILASLDWTVSAPPAR